MTRFKLSLLATAIITILAGPAIVRAQTPKIAIVDFERAVVESAEGKKAAEKFNTAFQAKQADLQKRQKDIDDDTKKLQNGARTLNDSAKAELQRDIDKKNTDLQRLNEDAQKELQTMRDDLLRPIAERATTLLNMMASQEGYTLVVDISNPQTNVVYYNPKSDVTAELVKRIDASGPMTPATETAPKPSTPAPNAARPAAPTPKTPAPAAPK